MRFGQQHTNERMGCACIFPKEIKRLEPIPAFLSPGVGSAPRVCETRPSQVRPWEGAPSVQHFLAEPLPTLVTGQQSASPPGKRSVWQRLINCTKEEQNMRSHGKLTGIVDTSFKFREHLEVLNTALGSAWGG